MALGFAAFLLACAIGMMVWQTSAWRSARAKEGVGEDELHYLKRRYRRRMQTGALMGLIALLLPLADWTIGEAQNPKLGVAVVGLMLALIGWIVALTAADLWATKLYFGRLRDRYQLEQVRLQAELRRLQTQRAAGSNGRPHASPEEPF